MRILLCVALLIIFILALRVQRLKRDRQSLIDSMLNASAESQRLAYKLGKEIGYKGI